MVTSSIICFMPTASCFFSLELYLWEFVDAYVEGGFLQRWYTIVFDRNLGILPDWDHCKLDFRVRFVLDQPTDMNLVCIPMWGYFFCYKLSEEILFVCLFVFCWQHQGWRWAGFLQLLAGEAFISSSLLHWGYSFLVSNFKRRWPIRQPTLGRS